MENFALQGDYFMTPDKEREYTVDDILALPEGERAELLDGKMYMMASPTATHQASIGWMYVKIYSYIESRKGNCQVFLSPFAVFLKNDNRNYVEPDILLLCDRQKMDNKGCHGAPDWMIEVLSPSSRTMDHYRKTKAYREAGVREYWIVDPEKETVTVYDYEHEEAPKLYHFTDKIRVRFLDGLTLDFNELKERLSNLF